MRIFILAASPDTAAAVIVYCHAIVIVKTHLQYLALDDALPYIASCSSTELTTLKTYLFPLSKN